MRGYELSDFGGQFLTTAPHKIEGARFPGVTAYVEWFRPLRSYGLSVTFVHGGGGQGSEFLRTPDGRPGWVHRFLRAGFSVFVLDRPGHGRSFWNTGVLGPALAAPSHEFLVPRFVEPEKHGLWPEAGLHTEWPRHDPRAKERFMASQGVMADRLVTSQRHVEAIAPELFGIVGDTVLLTHSAGGPCGWALSAMGGAQVKAVVAVEPLGYPGMDHPLGSFDNGLSAAPFAGQSDPYAPPVAVVTGEATWMRDANRRAAAFLAERGGKVDHILLEEHGIRGNGHMMMSEMNSDEIADLLVRWVQRAVATDKTVT